MRHEEDFIDDNTWDKIWGAYIQQRARTFLWLVYHDRVLGNYNNIGDIWLIIQML